MFYLVQPTGDSERDPELSVLRHRQVGCGMRERLTVSNHGQEPVHVELGTSGIPGRWGRADAALSSR